VHTQITKQESTMLKKTIMALLLFLHSIAHHAFAQNTSDTLSNLLTQYKGHVIYVDFWASWCAPCRQSFPWLNSMQSKYDKLKIISINVDNNKSFATAFLKEVPANFPIIYDPKGKLTKQYKLKGMPSSFIFNKNGVLISNHVGFNNTKKLKYEQEIQQLLTQ